MTFLKRLMKQDSFAGILLLFITILALILQNSAVSDIYSSFLQTHVELRVGHAQIAKPLILWVN
ncbi:MAG: Na+/H+ antiporter NhaA, partial [Mariprofundaceae bacterium]|nr:Na+/H+ antiporter NhaA [Mariprofundaceae bacterium]